MKEDHYLKPPSSHPLRLIDSAEGRHLAVFVGSEHLTHRTCGHGVGYTVNVDLFVLVNVAHGRFFLPLLCWPAAAVEV